MASKKIIFFAIAGTAIVALTIALIVYSGKPKQAAAPK